MKTSTLPTPRGALRLQEFCLMTVDAKIENDATVRQRLRRCRSIRSIR